MSVIATASIKIVGDVSDLQKRLTEAERKLNDFGGANKKVSGALEGHTLSLGRVERALASYVGRAAGANAVTESLSVAFGSFAVGGGVVAGVLIGIGAIVGAYELLTAGSRKAAEESDKLTKTINDQADATDALTEAGRRLTAQRAADQAKAVRGETGAGIFSQLLQGMAPGGQSMGALTTGDAAAKAERIASTTKAAQKSLNELGVTIGKNNEETERRRKQLADEAAAAAAKLDAEFQKRIDTLSKGLVFEDIRKTVTQRLITIEHALEAQVNSGTLSLERRIVVATRLGQVMDALNQKFNVSPKYTDVSQLIGITGNGETAASRAYSAYGQPMGTVKYNTGDNGLLVRPGQHDLIGVQEKAITAADKNTAKLSEVIANTAQQTAQIIGNALLQFGNGNRGSQVGGALGAAIGGGVGAFAVHGAIAAAAAGTGTLGGAILGSVVPVVGTVIGAAIGGWIGGLFGGHKKAVDQNTNAVRALTQAMLQNAPSGFKIEPYRYGASDPIKQLQQNYSRYKTRGGPRLLAA